jgi:hypothetical protein
MVRRKVPEIGTFFYRKHWILSKSEKVNKFRKSQQSDQMCTKNVLWAKIAKEVVYVEPCQAF